MVELSIENRCLHVEMKGTDRIWAFKSKIEVPLRHVQGVKRVEDKKAFGALVRELGAGIRTFGTDMPWVIAAGSYYFFHTGRVFIDVHFDYDRIIVIDLHDERYKKLILEVENPAEAVRMIGFALAGESAGESAVGE